MWSLPRMRICVIKVKFILQQLILFGVLEIALFRKLDSVCLFKERFNQASIVNSSTNYLAFSFRFFFLDKRILSRLKGLDPNWTKHQ